MKSWIYLLCLLVLFSCARVEVKKEKQPDSPQLGEKTEKPSVVKRPRLLEGELILRFRISKVYKGVDLYELRKKVDVDASRQPCLYVWCAQPTDQYNQEIKSIRHSIPPAMTYRDETNGNRISYWNLTNRLPESGKGTIELRRRISLVRYETNYEIDPDKIGEYDRASSLYRTYTRSEPSIELTEEIRTKASQIVGDETNPHLKAKKIYRWMLEHVSYHYPPEERGAGVVFKTRKGDCGEYAHLFCALCRSVGIPARFVSGLWIGDKFGFHAWAEYYLPGYGWTPADPSRSDSETGDYNWYYLGKSENTRLTVSRGSNLPIQNTPDWASYENSDVQDGETPFMQFATVAAFGIDYEVDREFKSERNELVEEEGEWISFRPPPKE